jgi:hypothetical protein
VTLGSPVGASDAVALGLVDGPAVAGLSLGVRLGEAEGLSLEVIVGRSLGWSDDVTLGSPVGASDAVALGLVDGPAVVGLSLGVRLGEAEDPSL